MAVYVGFFVLLSFWTLLEDVRIDAPRWKLLLRGVGTGLGSAGMILYVLEAVPPGVAVAWRFVFPLLVVEAVACGAWDLRYGAARVAARYASEDGPPSAAAQRRILWTSAVLGLIVAVPYFALNYLVAYA